MKPIREDFKDLVKNMLVFEYGESEDDAVDLIKKHYRIVISVLMKANNRNELYSLIRPCALAICLAESKEGDGSLKNL